MGDCHIGNLGFQEQQFKVALKNSQKIVIMGDLIEGITKKDTRHSRQDDVMTVDQQIVKAIQLLKPHASRIIYYIRGNHENTVISHTDINPMEIICDTLKIPQGITEYIHLEKTTIWVSHGTGAPLTIGGCFNQIEKFANTHIADISAIGHTHQLMDAKRYRHPNISYQLINTGTFLQDAEYARMMKLPPAAIGYYEINMKTKKATRREF